jgi:hypothetical protein
VQIRGISRHWQNSTLLSSFSGKPRRSKSFVVVEDACGPRERVFVKIFEAYGTLPELNQTQGREGVVESIARGGRNPECDNAAVIVVLIQVFMMAARVYAEPRFWCFDS